VQSGVIWVGLLVEEEVVVMAVVVEEPVPDGLVVAGLAAYVERRRRPQSCRLGDLLVEGGVVMDHR